MPTRLDEYRARIRDNRIEVASILSRMRTAGRGLSEQLVQSRIVIQQSREVMKRTDDLLSRKTS